MAWVAVGIAVVGTGVSIAGSNASARSQKAAIAQQQYNMRMQASFNAEALPGQLKKAEIDFESQYIQRLEGYNQARNVQLVTAGYQGKTADSLLHIQQADDLAFDYDNKMANLELDLNKKAIEMGVTQQNLGLQRDIESGNQAKSAITSAARWQAASAVMQGIGTGMSTYQATGGSQSRTADKMSFK